MCEVLESQAWGGKRRAIREESLTGCSHGLEGAKARPGGREGNKRVTSIGVQRESLDSGTEKFGLLGCGKGPLEVTSASRNQRTSHPATINLGHWGGDGSLTFGKGEQERHAR